MQGYDGSAAAYINRDTICFRCGNNLKFLTEGGHENIFPSGGEALGVTAVHSINKVFAVAEVGVDPKISVFQYPSFKHVRELTGIYFIYIYTQALLKGLWLLFNNLLLSMVYDSVIYAGDFVLAP